MSSATVITPLLAASPRAVEQERPQVKRVPFHVHVLNLHKEIICGSERSRATETLKASQTAFKAALAAEALQKEAEVKDALIVSKTSQIQTLETRLAEVQREQESLRGQLHAQTDQIDIQDAQNNDLSRRLSENEVRCREIESDLVKARTEVHDRKKIIALIRERKDLSDAEEEKASLTACSGCITSFIGAFFCTPLISVPLGGTVAALTLSDPRWAEIVARKKEIKAEIKAIEERLPS